MVSLPRIRIALTVAFGLILLVTNIYKSSNCGQLSGCMDTYWANFWLISFDDGYRRRALLGQIVGLVSNGELDYRLLNIAAFTIAVLVLAAIFTKYFFTRTQYHHWYLVLLVLLTGPTTTVLFEVMGDPLQIAFLVCCFYSFIARRVFVSLSLIMGGVLSLLVILLHEAALFLFVPVIYLIHCASHQKDPKLVLMLAVLLGVGCFYIAVLNNQPTVESKAVLILKDMSIYRAPSETLPPYISLLKGELNAYFGSIYDFLIMIRKTIGVLAFPILGLLLLSMFCKDVRTLGYFLFLLLFSLPLFVIARDWGRFLVYIFLAAMLVSSVNPKGMPIFSGRLHSLYAALLDRVLRLEVFPWALPVIAALYRPHANYRVFGLSPDSSVIFCLALILMVFYSTKSIRRAEDEFSVNLLGSNKINACKDH